MEIWKTINGYPNYKISNYGRIFSFYTNRLLTPYKVGNGFCIYLSHNKKSSNHRVRRLVLNHFEKSNIKQFAGNIRLNESNHIKDLMWMNRGDLVRFSKLGRKRGVYQFKTKDGYEAWRVVLKVDNKAVTIGYYKTHFDAQKAHYDAFKAYYGYEPYSL